MDQGPEERIRALRDESGPAEQIGARWKNQGYAIRIEALRDEAGPAR